MDEVVLVSCEVWPVDLAKSYDTLSLLLDEIVATATNTSSGENQRTRRARQTDLKIT